MTSFWQEATLRCRGKPEAVLGVKAAQFHQSDAVILLGSNAEAMARV